MAKNYGANPGEVDGTIKDSLKNKEDYISLVLNNTDVPSITFIPK